MGISLNGGTPKSSILIGCSIINHPFRCTPIFGNTYIYIYILGAQLSAVLLAANYRGEIPGTLKVGAYHGPHSHIPHRPGEFTRPDVFFCRVLVVFLLSIKPPYTASPIERGFSLFLFFQPPVQADLTMYPGGILFANMKIEGTNGCILGVRYLNACFFRAYKFSPQHQPQHRRFSVP